MQIEGSSRKVGRVLVACKSEKKVSFYMFKFVFIKFYGICTGLLPESRSEFEVDLYAATSSRRP